MGGGGTTPATVAVALFGEGDDKEEGAMGREPGCGAGGDEVGSVEVEAGYVFVGVYIFPDVLVDVEAEVGAGIAGAPGLAAG